MSVESARDFWQRVKSDKDFAAGLAAATDDQERRKLAVAAGYDFTSEELDEVRSRLTDAEVAAVAGGSEADYY
ncbi:MAG: Nif11-like leader peptide family RiPP precursor [Actinobacteria bacterium]|nr:Nif11-like leader peptide family RiPP precursor [Actinomycetota bacterium]